ncbi:MAG: hypothetical protein FWD25_08440 [Clostridia bacterium]|nr:hypothetical protein [Clostridia bacterium]
MSKTLNAPKEIVTYLYQDDTQKMVYATLAFRCGFAYRYAYIRGEEHSRELNQGFPYVLPHYIKHRFQAQAKKSVHVTPYRCATCFSLIADPLVVWDELAQLQSVVFALETDKETFELAKSDAMEALKKAYTSPKVKSFFHMLEFSDCQKAFLFSKFSTDLHDINYETFQQYFDEFIRLGHAALLLSGDPALEDIPPQLALTNESTASERIIFCAEALDPALQSDAHKVVAASEPFQMRCMRFSFSNQVSMIERYLLLHILAGQVDGGNRDIHVDAFDASIILLDDACLLSKHKFRECLTKDFVEVAKARILHQLEFDKSHSQRAYYAHWGNMLINGIELSQFLEAVVNCTEESIIQIFDRADPIVDEGTVILKKP